MTDPLRYEPLTFSVIGGFFDVYNYLGFGLPEHLYMKALEIELRARGHEVGREVYVPVFYREHELGKMRLDMLVDEKLVVEGKAAFDLHRSAKAQVYSYLKATKLEVGLLLHFGPEANFYRVELRHSAATVARQPPRTKGYKDHIDLGNQTD